MSTPTGQREVVFCYECEDEWFRDGHGLTCPRCQSDFVEVVPPPFAGSRRHGRHDTVARRTTGHIEANNNPHDFLHGEQDDDRYGPLGSPSPSPGLRPFEHTGQPGFSFSNFPPQQPANRAGPDFMRTEYTPGGGMVFTSFSYSSNINRSPDAHNQIINNFGDLLQGLLGNIAANRNSPLNSPPLNSPPLRPRDPHRPQQPQQGVDPMLNRTSQFFPPQNGTRSPVGPPMMGGFQQDDGGMQAHPLLNMMRMVLSGHPAMMNGHGDAAYSQDDFDRIMSQLLDQAQQGGGEPPASQQEIARIPKVTVDQDWLDRQEHKECTICMEEAKLGDEISELWCRHWYHPFCIKQWLDAHGACPLCRKTLQQGREEWEAKNAESPKRERRRSSKQHTHSHNSYDPRGYRDEGGSSGSSGGGGDAGNSSGGGIRDRISRFLGSNG